jgi:hypothetical protein
MWLRRLLDCDDDDALSAVVKMVHERLVADRSVANPVNEKEALNRMSDEAWEGFIPRLDGLLDIVQRAEETADEASAALIWSEAFSFLMPLPEIEEFEVAEADSGRALMQIPDITIEVYARNPRRLVERHRNEVPGVAKDCDLVFSIATPQLIPQFATIEWTVRNVGDDADWHSDLGHRKVGMQMLQAEEKTAYIGTHFMDCIIRHHGSVYAVRRIPVTVRDVRHVARNAPKPAYTRLRIRGR